MRSRYTAYTRREVHYLLSTWHVSTRPPALDLDSEPKTQWLGLKIVTCVDGQPGHSTGTVEFIARYRINGRVQRLHEVSRFVCESGRWYYLNGKLD